ncbi:MAG: enoyl-CoA hydratase/isomerase family protein [Kordiimonadaceae bacterium]|nr:enoyl-CoA hydratase/isomerase family protein [Kordiimonadaceae bacterium]
MSVVSTEINNDIAVIIIDNPPVNALSHAVREGVSRAFVDVEARDDVRAIILCCAGRTFCAGADISEFGKPPKSPSLPELIDQMDKINIPLIAAIHGTALGGGFELALCCHYRILEASAKVGLPEVNLGLIPGAGGTQRLPRLIGVSQALDMITSGKPVSAEKTLALKIADRISQNNLKQNAITFAEEIIKNKQPAKRVSDLDIKDNSEVFDIFAKKIAARTRGFLAPAAAIEAVKAATTLSFKEGLMVEREQFIKLVEGAQSKAQCHLFFAEREAAKVPGIDKNTAVYDIGQVAVIGGGIMGCGIAVSFLNKMFPVTLLEISPDACGAARQKITNIYDSSVKKGRITEDQKEKMLAGLILTCEYDDIANADLVIEAVFEKMEIKKQVFEKLDSVMKPTAILATNTSFLDINEIASVTSRPQNVLGLHFFSPAHIMPLLEIVRTDHTSNETLATALKLAKMVGKTAVISGVCYGFIANRMSSCYGREAGLLLLEGADVEQVDRVLYEFGMPMGMFTMLDMAGIDIGVMAREKLGPELYDQRAFAIHTALVKDGNKGQKTGAGFYVYDGGQKSLNPMVTELAKIFADAFQITRRTISDKEIEERCIFALINEGFKIVEEGIALRASDVDVVYTSAFGFPRYKGGPLFYAEQIGLDYVVRKINEFAKMHGERWWKPSNLMIKLATK